jgi:hypothetical protein
VVIPLHRTGHLWLDPHDTDTPRSLIHRAPPPTPRGTAFHWAQVVARWIAAAATLLALVLPGVGGLARIVAVLVVWRTAVCVLVFPVVQAVVVYEARALVTSHVLALALVAAVLAWTRRRRPEPK